MTIKVLTENEKESLVSDIEKCLEILYRLEGITQYEESAISNCINLLQKTNVKNIRATKTKQDKIKALSDLLTPEILDLIPFDIAEEIYYILKEGSE